MQVFFGSYFPLTFYPISMQFGHDIPRVVRYSAIILSLYSSGFVQNLLDHYMDQCQFFHFSLGFYPIDFKPWHNDS